MSEPKTSAKEEYRKIITDPIYKQSLGLTTEASICKYLKITTATKDKWRNHIESEGLSKGIKDERLAKVINKLYQKSLEGKNPNNARVFKELLKFVAEQGESGSRELTAADFNLIAIRTRDTLREEYRCGSGSCPVCLRPKVLRTEPCNDTKHEHGESGKMAILGIPN
jgi:hypothetical protein